MRVGVSLGLFAHLLYAGRADDLRKEVEKAFEALEKNSFKALRTVLWAGLIHDDVNITEIAVGNLIDMSNVTDLIAQLNQAFDSDMPVVEKDPTGEVQNQHPNGKAPVVLAVQKQE